MLITVKQINKKLQILHMERNGEEWSGAEQIGVE